MLRGSKLTGEDVLRERSWGKRGAAWAETAGEEETARRTKPEERQKAKWEGAPEMPQFTPADDVQKGTFSVKLERKFFPRFLIYLEII